MITHHKHFLIFIFCVVGISVVGFGIFLVQKNMYQSHSSQTQVVPTEILSPSPTILPTVNPNDLLSLLKQFTDSDISWNPTPETTTISPTDDPTQTVPAIQITGTATLPEKTAFKDSFWDDQKLTQNGWTQDKYLTAGGPMGDEMGYEKTINGKMYIASFSFELSPENHSLQTDPNGPPQLSCPCQIAYTLAVSQGF